MSHLRSQGNRQTTVWTKSQFHKTMLHALQAHNNKWTNLIPRSTYISHYYSTSSESLNSLVTFLMSWSQVSEWKRQWKRSGNLDRSIRSVVEESASRAHMGTRRHDKEASTAHSWNYSPRASLLRDAASDGRAAAPRRPRPTSRKKFTNETFISLSFDPRLALPNQAGPSPLLAKSDLPKPEFRPSRTGLVGPAATGLLWSANLIFRVLCSVSDWITHPIRMDWT